MVPFITRLFFFVFLILTKCSYIYLCFVYLRFSVETGGRKHGGVDPDEDEL